MNKFKNINTHTLNMVYIALFTALLAICAWITVPFTVPITLQTFAVLTTVGMLGKKRGTICVLVYLALGACGLPVFSGFKGGLGSLLGTTGGYLVGFVFTALISGFLIEKSGDSAVKMYISMVIGVLVCYAFGTAWFYFVYTNGTGPVGIITILSWCVFPFLLPDAAKIALSVFIVQRLRKVVRV